MTLLGYLAPPTAARSAGRLCLESAVQGDVLWPPSEGQPRTHVMVEDGTRAAGPAQPHQAASPGRASSPLPSNSPAGCVCSWVRASCWPGTAGSKLRAKGLRHRWVSSKFTSCWVYNRARKTKTHMRSPRNICTPMFRYPLQQQPKGRSKLVSH